MIVPCVPVHACAAEMVGAGILLQRSPTLLWKFVGYVRTSSIPIIVALEDVVVVFIVQTRGRPHHATGKSAIRRPWLFRYPTVFRPHIIVWHCMHAVPVHTHHGAGLSIDARSHRRHVHGE